MNKKILILLGLTWNITGFFQAQTTTDLVDSYQPPQTVVNQTVRMLPGFHADSKNVIYNGAVFWAKTGSSTNGTTTPPVVYNPENGENYIYTRTYLAPVTSSNDYAPQIQNISYFDGLGRPKQNIAIKASPTGKDLVTKIEYDAFGRQDKDFLPMPQQSSTSGAIYGTVSETVGNPLYDGTAPFYMQKDLELSPLNRPLSTTAPGVWSTNSKKTTLDYKSNITGEVLRLITNTTWSSSDNATSYNLQLDAVKYYDPDQLYKNETRDEDRNLLITFKNTEGQTILERKNDGSKDADTYYVYNDYDQLAFIISPVASETLKSLAGGTSISIGQSALLDDLCYQFRYDNKRRLVEKKLPGKGWEYMIYDSQDRLVMTQDANLGGNNQWIFTKYDKLGRVCYTGLYTSSQNYESAGRVYEQGQVNTKGVNNVSRTTTNFAQPGLLIYYDNDATKNYPNTIAKILSVNYYDTYPADKPDLSTLDFAQTTISDNAQANNINTTGLPVASYLNNVENSSWTKSYVYYDDRGRGIETYSKNHLGGYSKTESFLDFAGVPKKIFTYHKRKSTDTELVIKEEFVYDFQNRLLTHTHEVVGKTPKELLVENHYNEIGQLDWKKVGGVSGSPLQTINYSYNVRGWLKGINSSDIFYNASDESYILTGGKLFGYNIRYNNPENASLGAAKYNGNIAEVDWISRDASLKRYGYQYDGLNRLLKGNYQDPGTTLPETHINDEALTYDLNGNIKTLVRNGKHGKYYTPVVVDNLGYQYTGNKVTNIMDASGNSSGYEGVGQSITYDPNGSGNMIAIPDKKISAIAYNFLNLPTQINQNGNTIKYFYRADGTKVKKQFTLVNSSGTKIINTEYLDGFQYSTPNTEPIRKALETKDDATMEVTTAGEEEAFSKDEDRKIAIIDTGNPPMVDNMILSFFPTAEGYYDYENLRYIYQYKDHLGNVRVSYVKNGSTLEIRDRNDYYPFGMSFLKPFGQVSVYDPMAIPYNYKYGNKELQEFGGYDFGARIYFQDAAIFGQHDPLSEQTLQPYGYAHNNPIMFRDPTGMSPVDSQATGSLDAVQAGSDCPDCPKPSYNGQLTMGSDGVTYGAAAVNEGSSQLEWLKNTDIEGVTVTGKSKSGGSSQAFTGGGSSSGSPYSGGNPFPLQGGGIIMMDSVWDVLGIALANSKPENKYAAFALGALAIGVSRGKAADDVLKAESKIIGLGVADDLVLHRGTGAITWLEAGWQKAGLTNVNWGKAFIDKYHFKSSFYDATKNATGIRFEVSNFNPFFHKPGMTNFEFNHIISNPALLQKTTFIQNGSQVFWNGTTFIK
ncbi:MAG: RHS repeat-associated core domain-containing protein [Chryseobacterium sp.]|nr:RHS repeat-associated core domain-containing protein [Chryseobacterium sp.]